MPPEPLRVTPVYHVSRRRGWKEPKEGGAGRGAVNQLPGEQGGVRAEELAQPVALLGGAGAEPGAPFSVAHGKPEACSLVLFSRNCRNQRPNGLGRANLALFYRGRRSDPGGLSVVL